MGVKSLKIFKNYFSNTLSIQKEGLANSNVERNKDKCNTGLSFLNSERTVSFWFKTNDNSLSQSIIGFSGKNKYSYVGISYNNTFIIRRSAENYKRFNYIFKNNKWYHAVIFIKGDYVDDIRESKLWINGNEVNDIKKICKNSAPALWDKISLSAGYYQFKGDVQRVRIYNCLLEKSEIVDLYYKGSLNLTVPFKLDMTNIPNIRKQNIKEYSLNI